MNYRTFITAVVTTSLLTACGGSQENAEQTAPAALPSPEMAGAPTTSVPEAMHGEWFHPQACRNCDVPDCSAVVSAGTVQWVRYYLGSNEKTSASVNSANPAAFENGVLTIKTPDSSMSIERVGDKLRVGDDLYTSTRATCDENWTKKQACERASVKCESGCNLASDGKEHQQCKTQCATVKAECDAKVAG